MTEKLGSDDPGIEDDVIAAIEAWSQTEEGRRTLENAAHARAEGRTVPLEDLTDALARLDEQTGFVAE